MDLKRNIVIGLMALMTAALVGGCALASKDSGGDQTGDGDGLLATAQYVGLENCYTCHNTKFYPWMESRHANFDYENEEEEVVRVDYTELDPGDELYFDIVGAPDPHPDSSGGDRCGPCHTGPDYGGNILDANYYGDVFPDPNIGQIARPVIGCEACHGGGSFHYGTGALPYPNPGFEPCATLCHDFNYEAEDYGAHHYVDSDRYWLNDEGESAHDAHSEADEDSGHIQVAIADTTIAGVAFSVWSLPAPDDPAWVVTNDENVYAGPYHFVPHEVIKDTHFNAVWILNEDDKVTIYSVPTATLGYVNLDNDSPNTGLVNADDPESCTASCHDAHVFDLAVNEQWAHGAHRPYPEGPVISDEDEDEPAPIPEGPMSWHAVDHGDFSGSCDRCHTSVGFAEVAPGFASYDWVNGDGWITCNACHDGENYPSGADKRLRFEDEVALFNNDGSVISTVDNAGTSAVCIYCHQGREDPSRVSGTRFRNMHYLASAAVQYAEKGYDYAGTYGDYAGPMSAHANTAGNCVGCHMDDYSETIGGHTFHMSDGETENVAVCATSACHGGGLTDYDDAQFNPPGDWDGDGNATESARAEIDGLLHDELLPAIEAYDPEDDGPNVYYEESNHPYFFTNDSQVFDTTVMAAAYNWQFIYKDPGAWVHNGRYAAQLLRDSYEDLTGESLGGTRPSDW